MRAAGRQREEKRSGGERKDPGGERQKEQAPKAESGVK